MTVRLTVSVSETWHAMLVRLAGDMTERCGREVGPGDVMASLMKLGLRAAGVEACTQAAETLDLTSLTEAEWAQLDTALAKLMRHGAAGAS